ncbi:putative nucleoporin [Tieghemostelium lacteum]|uniref:Putative nucleoporin n=1 Tax=Tieghemostelium lacteum TaxID=361077 RepID=A0A152A8A5_TIELA|nr:putative nucleoporin [Tieghemostelium lacteum]|eukprot:KYR02463.1 putative nucleoporin [Tieghemostelium lacteum]
MNIDEPLQQQNEQQNVDTTLNNLNIKLCEIPLKSFSGNSPIYKEFTIPSSSYYSNSRETQEEPYFKSGGYSYKQNKNRYILWRINGSSLELSEYQLTQTLTENSIRLNFQNTLIKSSEIGFFETSQYLVVSLITSNKTFYRFLFPHPNENVLKVGIKRKNDSDSLKSIFSSISLSDLDNSYSKIRNIVPDQFTITSIRFWQGNYMAIGSTDSGTYWIELSDFRCSGELSCRQRSEVSKSSFFSSFFKSKHEQVIDLQISNSQALDANNYLLFILTGDCHLKILSSRDRTQYRDLTLDFESWKGHSVTLEQVRDCKMKVKTLGDNHYLFVFYIELVDESIFSFYTLNDPTGASNDFSWQLEKLSFSKQVHLTDFQLHNNQLHTLWNNSESEDFKETGNQLSYKYLNWTLSDQDNMEMNQFYEAFMSPPLIRSLVATPLEEEEIKDYFLERLFQRSQFTGNSIVEALRIYKTNFNYDPDLSLEVQTLDSLNDKISNIIQSNPGSNASAIRQGEWEEFYSLCVRNQLEELQGTGIFIHTDQEVNSNTTNNNSLIFLIKKNELSLMKPTSLETLYQVDEFHSKTDLHKTITSPDILNMLDCIELIAQGYNHSDFSPLELELSTEKVSETILNQCNLLLQSPDFINRFQSSFGKIHEPLHIVENILIRLEAEFIPKNGSSIQIRKQMGNSSPPGQGGPEYWSGDTFIDILSSSFEANIKSKFQNLIAITLILQCCTSLQSTLINVQIDQTFFHLYNQSLTLLSQYFLLNWSTTQIYHRVIDESTLTLDEINLNSQSQSQSETIIYHLLKIHISQFSSNSLETPIHELINLNISKLLLVLCSHKNLFPLATFLVEQHQFTQLQHLLAMVLHTQNGVPSMELAKYHYLHGICQVNFGDYDQAYKSLLRGVEGLNQPDLIRICSLSSESLVERLFTEHPIDQENSSESYLTLQYILKSIKLFEQKQQNDYIIQLSIHAIDFIYEKIEDIKPKELVQTRLEQLSSLLFKCALESGKYQYAFEAANMNPTTTGSEEYLKKLVIHLSQNNKIQELYTLPFKPYFVERHLITLSKSQDIYVKPDYYMILYGFYIQRANYQGAASVLYEKATRILTESHSVINNHIDSDMVVSGRLELLSLTIASLKLLDPSNRYLQLDNSTSSSTSKEKRKLNSEFDQMSLNSDSKKSNYKAIRIIWITEIQREYIYLLSYRYLLQVDPKTSDTITEGQLLEGLIQNSLYDRALTLGIAFDFDLSAIFESMALKCLQLRQPSTLVNINNIGFECSDYLHLSDPSTIAWEVLKNYLERYDQPETDLDCLSISKLLSLTKSNNTPDHRYKVYGIVSKGTLEDLNTGIKFQIHDESNCLLTVISMKKVPLFFEEGSKLVVEGTLDKNQFIASKVLCKRGQSRYHEAVADRILSSGSANSLPNWLAQWFLNGRADVLFKLYFKHSRILEAFGVLQDLFATAKTYTSTNRPVPFNIPYNIIDQFLQETQEILQNSMSQDEKLKRSYNTTMDLINSHLKSIINK